MVRYQSLYSCQFITYTQAYVKRWLSKIWLNWIVPQTHETATFFSTILSSCPQNVDGLITVMHPRGHHESIAPSGHVRCSKRFLLQKLHRLSRNMKLNTLSYSLLNYCSLLPKWQRSDRKPLQAAQIGFSPTTVKTEIKKVNPVTFLFKEKQVQKTLIQPTWQSLYFIPLDVVQELKGVQYLPNNRVLNFSRLTFSADVPAQIFP